MNYIRKAEVILGYTLNHFTLKNLLKNERNLYRQIFELRSLESQSESPSWPKMSAFVPLLYAKSIGISDQTPTLNWCLDHGLLPKQLLLAQSVQLLLEACALHKIENDCQISTPNHSKTLYRLALNELQKLREPHITHDMCICLAEYQRAVDGWQKLEQRFFRLHRWPTINRESNQVNQHQMSQSMDFNQTCVSTLTLTDSHISQEERLTFENYANFDQCLDYSRPNNIPTLLSQWEQLIYGKYAAFIGSTCQAMAFISGHRTEKQLKLAFQFGQSFAFAFAASSEFNLFLKGPNEEKSQLKLPLLLFLLSNIEKSNCSELIDRLRDSHLCSLQSNQIYEQVRTSDAMQLTSEYIDAYTRKAEQSLAQLRDSDSKQALCELIQQLKQIKTI